jgi:hypothetical protein
MRAALRSSSDTQTDRQARPAIHVAVSSQENLLDLAETVQHRTGQNGCSSALGICGTMGAGAEYK